METNSRKNSAGIGYVVLKEDLNINDFINFCKRNKTVSIILEEGGSINNVPCTSNVFEDIVFPSKYKELGSKVVWINNEAHDEAIVIATYPPLNEVKNYISSKKNIRKDTKNGVAEVLIDGDEPAVIINCQSLSEKKGKIILLCNNASETAELSIVVGGDIKTKSKNNNLSVKKVFELTIDDPQVDKKKTTISYEKGKGFYYEDEFDNKQENNKEGIIFNDGKNGGIIKIEELKKQYDLNLDAIKQVTAASFTAIDAVLNGLLPGSGTSATLFNSSASAIQNLNTEIIENKKIKH
jgi:hypothetical protein